jgi:hypothetical protein
MDTYSILVKAEEEVNRNEECFEADDERRIEPKFSSNLDDFLNGRG